MDLNLRCFKNLSKFRYKDENISTKTSEEQIKVEKSVEKLYQLCARRAERVPDVPRLLRHEHGVFLKKSLISLPSGYEALDASRTWLCYWILHSLALLDIPIDSELQSGVIQFLSKCQSPNGGFGGGPGQYPHLAPTYSAVNALCIIGSEEAYKAIDREGLQRFLWSVRCPNGAFRMHVDGEEDIRGVYCALAVATLTNVFTKELFDKSAEWIISCQTYEGGFSGCPGMEAHGGYAFCGLAGLIILGKGHLCDTKSLMRWTVNRQMKLEGGFQGRTNKLVDGCYSFWQAGAFPLINNLLRKEESKWNGEMLFDQEALQEYILVCCQHPSGGLVDKPGKRVDVYHTCYTLSGLAVAQQPIESAPEDPYVIGPPDNEIAPTHPVYNICPDMVYNAMQNFNQFPTPQIERLRIARAQVSTESTDSTSTSSSCSLGNSSERNEF